MHENTRNAGGDFILDLLAVLSRYYFVFLLICFIIVGVAYLRGGGRLGGERAAGRTQTAVILLFAIFAFAIVVDSVEGLIFAGFVLAFAIFASFVARRFYRRLCPLITNIMIFMLVLGFIMLQRLDPGLAMRQLIIAAAGFGVSMLIPLIFKIFKNFEKLEKLYIVLCVGLLGIVSAASLLGNFIDIPLVTEDRFGATNWISVFGITFQPSEFVKPIFVLFLAAAFRDKPRMSKLIFTSAASAALVLILVVQRDLGGALIFFTVFMVMLYASTGSKLLFGAGFGAMAIASVISYQIFPHIRVRVAAFLDPWGDIAVSGFQITQSLFAIGTWGAFGSGLTRGLPERIPVVERDVIFSAISEEFGWIFGLLLIALYGLLLIRGLQLARRAGRPLHALMATGFTIFLVFQAFVSIGGNIRFIPMTGVTLPFISYGGSSVFVSVLMVGVLNWLNGQDWQDGQIGDEKEMLANFGEDDIIEG
jgi:cell division protein FtsW (lipid II flippase)